MKESVRIAALCLGIFVGLPLLIMLFKCGFTSAPARCSKTLVFIVFAFASHLAAMAGSAWAGIAVAKKTGRNWQGWAAFVAVLLASSGLLTFMGIPFPEGSEFEADWI